MINFQYQFKFTNLITFYIEINCNEMASPAFEIQSHMKYSHLNDSVSIASEKN
jgi:hypothetical protein